MLKCSSISCTPTSISILSLMLQQKRRLALAASLPTVAAISVGSLVSSFAGYIPASVFLEEEPVCDLFFSAVPLRLILLISRLATPCAKKFCKLSD
jgi:hypothetical protein